MHQHVIVDNQGMFSRNVSTISRVLFGTTPCWFGSSYYEWRSSMAATVLGSKCSIGMVFTALSEPCDCRLGRALFQPDLDFDTRVGPWCERHRAWRSLRPIWDCITDRIRPKRRVESHGSTTHVHPGKTSRNILLFGHRRTDIAESMLTITCTIKTCCIRLSVKIISTPTYTYLKSLRLVDGFVANTSSLVLTCSFHHFYLKLAAKVPKHETESLSADTECRFGQHSFLCTIVVTYSLLSQFNSV
jgi:hypothetical protein